MRFATFAALLGFAILTTAVYRMLSTIDQGVATGSVGAPGAHPVLTADPRTAMNVVKVDWRREGFGLTAVADIAIRNNNGYAVRIDRISCRFRAKTGETEEHGQGVYDIVQPRTERMIRNVSLGFVNADAKGLDCAVTGARKDF